MKEKIDKQYTLMLTSSEEQALLSFLRKESLLDEDKTKGWNLKNYLSTVIPGINKPLTNKERMKLYMREKYSERKAEKNSKQEHNL